MSGGWSLLSSLLPVHVCKSLSLTLLISVIFISFNVHNCSFDISYSPFTVHMDLTAIIAVFNEDLARMYAKRNLLGLMKAVSGNAFVKRLGLVPSSAYDSIQKVKVIFKMKC